MAVTKHPWPKRERLHRFVADLKCCARLAFDEAQQTLFVNRCYPISAHVSFLAAESHADRRPLGSGEYELAPDDQQVESISCAAIAGSALQKVRVLLRKYGRLQVCTLVGVRLFLVQAGVY